MPFDNRDLTGSFNVAGFISTVDQLDRAKSELGMSYMLAQSGVPAAVTGTVAETSLRSIVIPGGSLGPNGSLRIYAVYSMTPSVNAKTLRCKLGGLEIYSAYQVTSATVGSLNKQRVVQNRGAQNAQITYPGWNELGVNGGGNPNLTGAIDTSVDQVLDFTGQLALGTETLTLESFLVELFPS